MKSAPPSLIKFVALASLSAATAQGASIGANLDEQKVPLYQLPDVLLCTDGTRVDSAELWRQKRRPELLQLFASEVYGKTLLGRPPQMRFVVREEIPDASGGRATRLRVAILFDGTDQGPQMELLVYLPNHVPGPVPMFLGLNFDGNYTTTQEPDLPLPTHWSIGLPPQKLDDHRPTEKGRGMHQHLWPYAYALEHGYGIATAAYGEIEPDTKEAQNAPLGGPRSLGPKPGQTDWGTIGGWSWALSRALDYLETHPRVDAKRVAVTGFSRLGKTALWAAAQDERFAMAVSHASGAGGAALSKRIFGETVKHLTSNFPHWFTPQFARYAETEAELPVDQHELLALIAPRPMLITSGTHDLWADPRGEFLSALHASPVYTLLGTQGLIAQEMPAPSRLIDSPLGYFLRPGGHDVTLEDWQAVIRFADKHLVKHP
jgi:hypothetical protein